MQKAPASVMSWHADAFAALDRLHSTRHPPDGLPSASLFPVLGFYQDHSILILNAQASRDLIVMQNKTVSSELLRISKMTVLVANRMLDLILNDSAINDLRFGFHNNMFIMICHAATEILHVHATPPLSSSYAIPGFLKNSVFSSWIALTLSFPPFPGR